MFATSLKGNKYLYIGILTGCLNIGLQGIFSGFNNYHKNTLFNDTDFSDCYGFTEDELDKILSYFGITGENVKEKIKREYDGYSCITSAENGHITKNLYNPYSIMNFVKNNRNTNENFDFGNYWIDSGSDNKYIIWSFLLYSGYITIVDEEEYNNQKIDHTNKQYSVEQKNTKKDDSNIILKNKKEINIKNSLKIYYIKIPNNEVLKKYRWIFECCLRKELEELYVNNNNKYIKNFIEGIFEKDIEKINENLTEYLKIFSPYHIYISSGLNENIYQVLLMQMFTFFNIENMKSEESSGYGRYDFGFPNTNKVEEDEYILIEVKAYRKKNKKNDEKNDKKNNIKIKTKKGKIKNRC
ncbi:hypothetical protein PIROE2DRAFT_16976 [Piromyces sp. E2]|nr:hypothetical protein PIROE2DRAFT_16976 [Piromyces sp. E2]|eukprot:OUM57896.1 hypothetical protein PIROE2DRAFT_16976 [Piromyces sp. E2]